jgi:predicted phage baseplate assembly protein
MTVEIDCRDDLPRRRLVRDRNGNGIDWVEVDDDGLTVTIAFLGPAPRLDRGNVRIEGGTSSGRPLRVVEAWLCEEDDPDRDRCFKVRLDRPCDSGRFRLCLVEADPAGRPSRRPLSGLDPRFACIDVACGVDCPADLDCLPGAACPPEMFDEPEIPYLGKDYASFRQLVLDRLALIMPEWTERHVPDIGIALVELLAYVGDQISYQQDAVGTEAYLETARLRTSVRRHVRLIDYPMHDGVNARAWVWLDVSQDLALARDEFWFITTPDGRGAAHAPVLLVDDLRQVPITAYDVFEPVIDRGVRLRRDHSTIHFWAWGQRECCLPEGATRATLLDAVWAADADGDDAPTPAAVVMSAREAAQSARARSTAKVPKAEKPSTPAHQDRSRVLDLAPGDVLVLREVRSPTTATPEDADITHRQAVRLTRVTRGFDAVYGVAVLEVEWADADALTFPLCLTAVGGEACLEIEVSVGHGNVILVDHGRRIDRCGSPPDDIKVSCPPAGPIVCVDVPCTDGHEPGDRERGRPTDRPTLTRSPVTFAAAFPAPERIAASQARLLADLPARVDERLRDIWTAAAAGKLTDVELTELRTIMGEKALVDAGLEGPGEAGTDQATAVAWLLGRKERILDRKLRRVGSLARRARSGYRLGPEEAAEIAHAWGSRYAVGLDGETAASWGPAMGALVQDPRAALPAITLISVDQGSAVTWQPRRDLLGSGPADRHFVDEVDDDGRSHLRFGDGVLGRALEPNQRFKASYRVGNGQAGNVPIDAISAIVTCGTRITGVVRVSNLLPARGGVDPEPVAEVRLMAPHAIRRLERAVTADDYAALAGQLPGVQRAAATLRWTGSWYEAQVGLDAAGRESSSAELIETASGYLHRYRRIGHDLRVGSARKVPIELALRVCVLPDHERGAVERAILDALSAGRGPDGTQGFFDPDRVTFGDDIAASALVGVVQAIPGVENVAVTRLERRFEGPDGELEAGLIDLGPLEVAELDRTDGVGRLRLDIRGGR